MLTEARYSELFRQAEEQRRQWDANARKLIGDGGKEWQAALDAWPVEEKVKRNGAKD